MGHRGDLSSLNYQTWATSKTELAFAEVSAAGEAFEMKAGPIGMAVGAQAYQEDFQVDADEPTKAGEIIGNAGSALGGERSALSSYMEFSVPLASNVEWNLAGRYDSYSDFGQAFSPKMAFRWQATPQVMFRSSIGRGFKAPNMDDLYQSTSKNWPDVY